MAYHRQARAHKAHSGFTLVELSIVMILSGLALVMITQMYMIYVQSRVLVQTREKMNELNVAMSMFLSNSGRYPCPADPTLSSSDPNFGREVNCTTGALGGVTRASAARDSNNNGTADDFVVVGAIPFVTLREGIESNICYSTTTGAPVACSAPDAFNPGEGSIDSANLEKVTDSWGRLMTYAVSQNLTRVDTYRSSDGGIAIETEEISGTRRPLTVPAGGGHYTFISHGENGAGGYNKNGLLYEVCPTGNPDEAENCDNDSTFVSGLRRMTDGAARFDDIVFFSAFTMSELWKNSQEDTIYNVNQNGNVGIGVTTPTDRLHIAGDVRVGSARGDLICNNTGSQEDCFPPDLLSGGNACMKCPLVGCVTVDGPVPDSPVVAATRRWGMTGIRNGHAICESFEAPLSSYLLGKTCPPGPPPQFMVGIRFTPGVMPPEDGLELICVSAP